MSRRITFGLAACLLEVVGLVATSSGAPASDVEAVRALLTKGRYAAAESLAGRVLPEVERQHGSNSLEYAQALDVAVLAISKTSRATSPETRRLAERAVAIKRKRLGPHHPELATSLRGLGSLQDLSADYAGARASFEQALAIREEAFGRRHADVAASLEDLGWLLTKTCDYDAASLVVERSLAIRDSLYGRAHLEVAQSLSARAYLRILTSDFVGAQHDYERALQIQKSLLDPQHPKVSGTLNSFAALKMKMGDYEAAKPLLEQALEIRRATLDPKSPFLAGTIGNLAWLYHLMDDNETAAKLYRDAIELFMASVGDQHPMISNAFVGYGKVLQSQKRYEEARTYFAKALEIRRAKFGPNSHDVADCLLGMSEVEDGMGDLTQATIHAREALGIHTSLYGPNHYQIARELVGLGDCLARTGDRVGALDASLRAEDIAREHLRLAIRALPENEALLLAGIRDSGRDLAVSLATSGLDSPSRRRVWDTVLRSRGLILDEMASRHRSMMETGDPEVAFAATKLAAARVRYANLVLRPPDHLPKGYLDLVGAARAEVSRAERSVTDRSARLRLMVASRDVSLADVESRLEPGDVLVAYVAFDRRVVASPGAAAPAQTRSTRVAAGGSSDREYLAFALRAGRKAPEVFTLGSAVEIDALVHDWVQNASRLPAAAAENEACRLAGAALRHRIWDPMASSLASAKRIFVVPDGAIHLVNLDALPADEVRYLAETIPVLFLLSAERDLVADLRAAPRGHGLLALGGADFDVSPLLLSDVGQQEMSGRSTVNAKVAYRGASPECDDFRSLRFHPLPASSEEARDVARRWDKAVLDSRSGDRAVEGSRCLLGTEAGEAAFKRFAPGRAALHLATHAFFLGEQCGLPMENARGIGNVRVRVEPPVQRSVTSPLLRAGLALSGANRRDAVGSGEEDGVLTAEEIATLDLRGAERVVLSACETGVGEVHDGEGIFGLRRAFQVAGARSVVMSLWPVRDDLAREWMSLLYEAWLVEKLPTARAVRAASVSMLRARRSQGLDDHPASWAAFVASGKP